MSRADEIDAEAAVIRNVAAQHEQDAAIARAELAREQLAAWRESQQPSVRMGPARVVVPFAPTALDYFAAHALSGIIADTNASGPYSAYAKDAFLYADAMLAEKAKRDGETKAADAAGDGAHNATAKLDVELVVQRVDYEMRCASFSNLSRDIVRDAIRLAVKSAGVTSTSPEPKGVLADALETAWLIEQAGGVAGAVPMYWAPKLGVTAWSSDSLDAARFTRKEDAEHVIAHVLNGFGRRPVDARAVEHGWYANAPLAPVASSIDSTLSGDVNGAAKQAPSASATLPKAGTKFRTKAKLGDTAGMLVAQEYLDKRRPNAVGEYMAHVAGHGGDVWWIIHEGGAAAPYVYTELEPVAEGSVKS